MKLIYIHQYFKTPLMNGGTRSYEMARRLVRKGHEVHMITCGYRSEDRSFSWRTTNCDGIHVHWLNLKYDNRQSYLTRMCTFVGFALLASFRIRKLQYDLVFATSTPLTVAIPGIFASWRSGVPFVFEVRDLWPELPVAVGALKNRVFIRLCELLERFAYNSATHIIALSEGMKRGICEAGIDSDCVSVIPNGCDLELFQNDYLSAVVADEVAQPSILYCGTLGHINGVEWLVRLASELKAIQSNIKILVVGDGAERGSLIELAKSMGVDESYIEFREPVSKAEVPALIATASVCVSVFLDLPEMRNNSANKVFDGMAGGKPIVINYGGWLHELIGQYEFGISVWNLEISVAAQRIHDFVSQPHNLKVAGENALKLAEENFDRNVLAEKFSLILTEALENRGGSS